MRTHITHTCAPTSHTHGRLVPTIVPRYGRASHSLPSSSLPEAEVPLGTIVLHHVCSLTVRTPHLMRHPLLPCRYARKRRSPFGLPPKEHSTFGRSMTHTGTPLFSGIRSYQPLVHHTCVHPPTPLRR